MCIKFNMNKQIKIFKQINSTYKILLYTVLEQIQLLNCKGSSIHNVIALGRGL